MSELEVVLDPGFKGGQRQSCSNSFRKAVPLRDDVGEGLLPILGSVGGHIKGVGVYLFVVLLLHLAGVGQVHCTESVHNQ